MRLYINIDNRIKSLPKGPNLLRLYVGISNTYRIILCVENRKQERLNFLASL